MIESVQNIDQPVTILLIVTAMFGALLILMRRDVIVRVGKVFIRIGGGRHPKDRDRS